MIIRRMLLDDIDRGLALCQAAQWNQVRGDWEHLIAHAECLAAVVDDLVVGTCALLDSEWIAMMLVDPAFRRRLIGEQLLRQALELTPSASIGLDATELGRPLYERHGFLKSAEIVRWRREGGPCEQPSAKALCRWRPGHESDHIGPVTASSIHEAANRVLNAVASNPRRSWILDVPESTGPEWRRWLDSTGFVPQRRFTRMYRGPAVPMPTNLYATAGPEFGIN